MNLPNLVERKERPLEKEIIEVEGPVEIGSLLCGDRRMRGLTLGTGSSIRLSRHLEYNEFQCPPRDLGWLVAPVRPWPEETASLSLAIELVDPTRGSMRLGGVEIKRDADTWAPVYLDWPVEVREMTDSRVVIRMEPSTHSGSVFLGVCEHTNLRKPILKLAKGNGIEIGPGNAPQILPGPDVNVRYLERSPIEEWSGLYNKTGARAIPDNVQKLWEHYLVGEGQKLDKFEAGELDFIFSSHVFEHFPNPLGTLEIWHKKLAPDGKVIGVVPDANNCFDLLQPLSRTEEWMSEWRQKEWDLSDGKCEKWCRYTQPFANPDKVKKSRFSIHAHYYTPLSFSTLLQIAVDQIGFRHFHIRHTRNHKDFVFLLQK